MPAEVTVYTSDNCPYCVRAKMILNKKGARFTEINVSNDDEKRAWLRQVTGARTVPQIFINGRGIGGCDDMIALDRSGQLDPLLAAAPSQT
jgi:glutaredoxin 3